LSRNTTMANDFFQPPTIRVGPVSRIGLVGGVRLEHGHALPSQQRFEFGKLRFQRFEQLG
jgi:hypothetical protein